MRRIGFETISDLLAALFATVQTGRGGLWRNCIFLVTGSPSMVENSLQKFIRV